MATKTVKKEEIVCWKRTRGGTWAVSGPASVVKVGMVGVVRKDGTLEDIEVKSVGKTFERNGVEWRYGYTTEFNTGTSD